MWPAERPSISSPTASAPPPPGAGRDLVAEISRVLVEGGIDLYRIQPLQASLESWFLEVTSRLGTAS